jgi:hypothetical protein
VFVSRIRSWSGRPSAPGRRMIGAAAAIALAAVFAVAAHAASPASVENPHPWVTIENPHPWNAIEHPHPWCYTCHSSW